MQVLRNLVEQRCNLCLICDVQLNSGEFATLFQARFFVCRGTLLGDLREGICPSSAEDQIRSTLSRAEWLSDTVLFSSLSWKQRYLCEQDSGGLHT